MFVLLELKMGVVQVATSMISCVYLAEKLTKSYVIPYFMIWILGCTLPLFPFPIFGLEEFWSSMNMTK